jgi:structural maintenance of chromosome 4
MAALDAEKKDEQDADDDQDKMDVDIPAKADPYQFHLYTPEELDSFSQRQLVADVALYEGTSAVPWNAFTNASKERVRNAKPNMDVLKQYRKREQEFLARAQDLDAVTMRRDACKKEYDELRKKRLEEFMTGFNQISGKLKEMYQVRYWSWCPVDTLTPTLFAYVR